MSICNSCNNKVIGRSACPSGRVVTPQKSCPMTPTTIEFEVETPTNFIEGLDGKSAYESAVDGGYTGTEEQFNSELGSIGELTESVDTFEERLDAIERGLPGQYLAEATTFEGRTGEDGERAMFIGQDYGAYHNGYVYKYSVSTGQWTQTDTQPSPEMPDLTEIEEAVARFNSFLNDTDSADETINKWRELESFLNGITDQQTLNSIINALRTELTTLIGTKQDTIIGAASSITDINLTSSKALVSDASGKVSTSTVSATELSRLSGVTSSVQDQLNSKQPALTFDATPTAGSTNPVTSGGVKDAVDVVSTRVDAIDVAVAKFNSFLNDTDAADAAIDKWKELESFLTGITDQQTLTGIMNGMKAELLTLIDGKQATVTGAATTITSSDLTPNRVLVSDVNGKVNVSMVYSSELGYLSGVSGPIQLQIDAKQPTLTFDGTPTAGSSNPVTSQGIRTAISTAEQHLTDLANTKLSGVYANDMFLLKTGTEVRSAITISYNNSTKCLELRGNDNVLVNSIDMSVFLKDGMLSSVEKYTVPEQGVETAVPYLKFTFNVDSGQSVIRISLSELIDLYDASSIRLTNAYSEAVVYAPPLSGDSMNVAIGKLVKGHSDNASALSGKQDAITGAASSIATSNLTASMAVVSDAYGKVSASSVTSAELGNLSGVTSPIQTQLDGKANAHHSHAMSDVSGLETALTKFIPRADLSLGQDDFPIGAIVEHVGATSGDYVNGYFYKKTSGSSGPLPAGKRMYALQDISKDPGDDVDVTQLIHDLVFVESDTETLTYYVETPATGDRLFLGDKDTVEVGDCILSQAGGTGQVMEHVKSVQQAAFPYQVRTIEQGAVQTFDKQRQTNAYVNSEGIKVFLWGQFSGTFTNQAFGVVQGNKVYKVVAASAWGGYTDDYVPSLPWTRINVQPETDISGKQDRLTFDTTPTVGSTNPVTSGGVRTAIENAVASLGRFHFMTASSISNDLSNINTMDYVVNDFVVVTDIGSGTLRMVLDGVARTFSGPLGFDPVFRWAGTAFRPVFPYTTWAEQQI